MGANNTLRFVDDLHGARANARVVNLAPCAHGRFYLLSVNKRNAARSGLDLLSLCAGST